MPDSECNRNILGVDEACLVLNTNDKYYDATIYSLSSDCHLCPFVRVSQIVKEINNSITFNTAKATTWRVYNDSGIKEFRSLNDESGVICQFQPHVGEHGIYKLTIENKNCKFGTIVESSNSYPSLAIIVGVVLCFLFGFSIIRMLVNLVRKKQHEERTNGSVNDGPPARRRVLSIDTFRGISILAMIFVNNGAGGYAFLEHATWNGLYIGDLIFPCFVWIMGFCIPISLSSQLTKGISRFSICGGILKRSIMLFLIGVSLNTVAHTADLQKIRIFGVLQRFGVAYFAVGIIYTILSRRNETKNQSSSSMRIADFISLLPQWIVVLIIVAVHSGITFYLPVPGCPTGYLGPGGIHDDGKYFNCTGGATGYIDKIILGPDHVFRYPTISDVYKSGSFDPEGILGCLTTIFQTFLGVQAGKILKVYRGSTDRIIRWLVFALFCACISVALNFTNVIPINKNLWSLSFVLLTTSFALVLLCACYLLIDVTSTWRGGPFRIPGMNALVMYIGHQVCYKIFPFHWNYGPMNNHMWLTIKALWDVAAWTLIAYIFHKKKIYITV